MPRKTEDPNSLNLEYTAMCTFFAAGKCLRGKDCQFAHSPSQIRAKPDLSRTSLCHDFMRKKSCKNGDQCRYAHGEKELRKPCAVPTAPKTLPPVEEEEEEEEELVWDPLDLASQSNTSTEASAMMPLMRQLIRRRLPALPPGLVPEDLENICPWGLNANIALDNLTKAGTSMLDTRRGQH